MQKWSFSNLLQFQFLSNLAGKYAVRVSIIYLQITADKQNCLRIAQFNKEESRGVVTYKLLVFLPDCITNLSYSNTELDYKWASGSYCQFVWTPRGWTVNSATKANVDNLFRTHMATQFCEALVDHIKLAPTVNTAAFNDNQEFC